MFWRTSTLVVLWLTLCLTVQARPRHLYLTWSQPDACHTITVNLQYRGSTSRPARVWLDTASHRGQTSAYPIQAEAAGHQYSYDAERRTIYHIDVTGLASDTVYYGVAGTETSPSREFSFRTPPETGPLQFVVGGDVYLTEEARTLFTQVARRRPAFAVVGGDLCYDDGLRHRWRWWDSWLDNWSERMRTPEGWLIPMILAIGNHEVRGGWEGTPESAPFYFEYFQQSGRKSYFARQIGRICTLIILDTGHVSPIAAQAGWLAERLEEAEEQPYTFAAYHVPLYPSLEPYSLSHSQLGRSHWVPSFDRYLLTAAFEHHEHTFKRTPVMRGSKPAARGTVYLGDGCWGQAPRHVAKDRKYLVREASVNHVWWVDLNGTRARFEALDIRGHAFDHCEQPPRTVTQSLRSL